MSSFANLDAWLEARHANFQQQQQQQLQQPVPSVQPEEPFAAGPSGGTPDAAVEEVLLATDPSGGAPVVAAGKSRRQRHAADSETYRRWKPLCGKANWFKGRNTLPEDTDPMGSTPAWVTGTASQTSPAGGRWIGGSRRSQKKSE